MPSASYFFNTISNTKDIGQFTQGEIDKDYTPYVVNKMVAQYSDLVHYADELNVRPNISKENQIHLLSELIPKKKRKVLWTKKRPNENLQIIMNYYNISEDKAYPFLHILTDKQIEELNDRLNTGGRD